MAAVAEGRAGKLPGGLGRGWGPLRRRGQDGAALAIYAAAWVVLIGRDAIADPAHTCACQGTSDPAIHMWSFVWWPHAIVHGLNPFFTHAIWPPGTNVGAAATVPAASLLLSPITAAFGPIVTYNVAFLLGPVLAAWLMFRLCRYLTGRWVPSLVAGYVFGFSSYVLAHMLGHLNLVLIFVLPAAVHLILLRLDDRVSSRRFVGLMAALLVLQFLISIEVLLTMLGFGVLALAFGYVFESPSRRARIRSLVPQVLLGGAIAAVVVSPFLYYAAKGIGPNPAVVWGPTGNKFSTDPLNYAIPTPVTWIGHQLTGSVAAKFISSDGGAHGKYDESAAYLGVPLLLLVGWFLASRRRRASTKVLVGLLGVVFVASLGAHLHVANPPHGGAVIYRPSIPLPWLPMSHLPVVDRVLPARLVLYVFFIAAIVVALALAEPARRRWPKWALAGVGVVLLIPNQALPYWHGRPHDPRFFTTSMYKRYLHPNEIVLVVPFAWSGDSMLWQAETGMRFRMVGGYLSPDVPPGYWREPVVRALLSPYGSGPITPRRWRAPLRDLIVRRRVGAVVVGPGASSGWRRVVASLGLAPVAAGGVVVYDVPAGSRA